MTNRSSQIDSVFLSCIDTDIIQTKFGLRGKRGEPEDDTNACFGWREIGPGLFTRSEISFPNVDVDCYLMYLVLALSVQL